MNLFAKTGTLQIPWTKKWISYLLCLIMLIPLFFNVLCAQADAVSGYEVKAWTSGDMHCYTVYKGSLPAMYEPTFYRFNDDVFKSGNRKISFYWQYSEVNKEQADAFWKYLGNKSKASKWYCGYYSITDSEGYRSYYGYKIEGWNGNSGDSLDKLLQSSPFINSDGTKLYVEYIGKGNQIREKWSEIRKVRECSAAIYLTNRNATIGFRFADRNGEPLYLYCP